VVVGYSSCSGGASARVEDVSKSCISCTSKGYTSEGYRRTGD
jgi:hypothetical protein